MHRIAAYEAVPSNLKRTAADTLAFKNTLIKRPIERTE